MSSDLDPIMQAAERLRRVQFPSNGERFGDVYGDCGEAGTAEYKRDLMTLSLFSLSVLPARKPVPITLAEKWQAGYGSVWGTQVKPMEARNDFWRYAGESGWRDGTISIYETEEDAALAIRWWLIEKLLAR